MDNRKNNGGKREGAGRKPKAEEIKLIEQMDNVVDATGILSMLYKKCLDGDTQAIKTWMQYRFGMPKQTIEQNGSLKLENFNVKDVIGFDNAK